MLPKTTMKNHISVSEMLRKAASNMHSIAYCECVSELALAYQKFIHGDPYDYYSFVACMLSR